MSVPSKARTFQVVKMQAEERLATTSELNCTQSGMAIFGLNAEIFTF